MSGLHTTSPVGFLRLSDIIGDPKRGKNGLFPVSRSAWWAGCKAGRFPSPVKLGPNTTTWRVEDIRALIGAVGAVKAAA